MALSSADREMFATCVRNWRAYWDERIPHFPADKDWVIAVADHLTACEGLLAEIRSTLHEYGNIESEGVYPYLAIRLKTCQGWQATIDTLLGPAATEGGG